MTAYGTVLTIPDTLTTPQPDSRSKVWTQACPVPTAPGLYAWWFRQTPAAVPTSKCVVQNGLTLLYVGISPSAPPPPPTAKAQAANACGIALHTTSMEMRRVPLCGSRMDACLLISSDLSCAGSEAASA